MGKRYARTLKTISNLSSAASNTFFSKYFFGILSVPFFIVRDMPADSINIHNCPFEWFREGEEFEEFIIQFAHLLTAPQMSSTLQS